ncbi:polysaccharide deacetylase family protein [Mesorhizobium sp. CA13]|jgi:peptidoglycan/xylan/chitin deacetylase (PgdA/CDA1 family)|uniref:polysaccharide deacetylase family protein n=1 Tax=unclassified Mesorhizobium TaxID=325217 RepID=UPI00112C86E5|nr:MULTISPECIES: polysaccharide deacetylase family protein [unclassified Mesorhizobium]MBZ9852439.1 polysaccharide deacetylase family protein [Mesorhizobium sp. CA13]MBZ9963275.1 polysaccharide deacetylase family protein [Mesorhizobium sp. BR1-1-2]MCA0012734.1 polysaccharide deacetylase family protein [Mesorhizobium sp. B294B1A1]MCA0037765.1 polysaccharide deacetylase family protein [Mesorhizobium sp. B292B1B]TPM50863.1 polysaccharide deacetylase [Mesorhizobium sp. B2-3-2]
MPLLLALLTMLAAFPAYAADRTIYLTFDDGPLNGTSNILDVLEAQQVPATLFMVGMHAQASAGNKALVRRAKALPLVTVGNHSYSHANNRYQHFYADTEGVVADMLRANVVLGLAPAVHARLPGRDVFRLPSMSKNDTSLGLAQEGREEPDYEFVAASGFYLYGWDHEWVHDDTGKPVQSVDHLVSEIDHLFGYGRFVKRGKMILLMHDEMFQDSFDGKPKLTQLITALKQRGYAFGTIQSYDD